MVKKKVEKPRREVTKRQLSHWQQQRRRQRIILGLGIFIIVAALGIVGAGWYVTQYQPLHQIVITVNSTKFDMNYYIKMLKYYGEGQPSYYMSALADEVVRYIEQNELIRQGAMELDITVSNDEIDEELKSYDPPLSKDYRDLVRAGMLISKLRDGSFEQQVPEFAEQRHIRAMFLESKSQANKVRARLEGGEDFAEVAEELSLDEFSKNKKGDLGWRPKGILTELLGTSIPDDYVFGSEVGGLSQPIYDEAKTKRVGYWLIKVLERKEELEEAHVQAILLGSEEEAQEVRSRLEAGEDFAALAEEYSQYDTSKENGGDLGWLTRDMVSPAFGEFAFNPDIELKTLSESIRDDTVVTTGGYWLAKVTDKDDYMKIEGENRDLLKAELLNEWLLALWDNAEIDDSYLDDDNKRWAIEKAIGS